MSSVTVARTDPWRCARCARPADLAPLALEVGLVRLAGHGADGFRLGSAGVEDLLEPLLEPCECGGPLEPGTGRGRALAPAFAAERLAPLARAGWAVLEGEGGRLAELRDVWRPRALTLLGRAGELGKEEALRLRIESRLERLQVEMAQARARRDEDGAEALHARYVELGTMYVQRFVVARERSRPG